MDAGRSTQRSVDRSSLWHTALDASIEQLGLQRFCGVGEDPLGGQALQSFSLNVSGVNLSPALLSRARAKQWLISAMSTALGCGSENDRWYLLWGNAPAGNDDRRPATRHIVGHRLRLNGTASVSVIVTIPW